MSDEKKPFTVTDRRHFTPEGAPREGEAVAAPPPPQSPPPQRAEHTDAAPDAARPRQPSPPGGAGEPEVDFASFVMSLATQASALLAGGDGAQLPSAEELRGVRTLISILEMLKDKTEGRRTPDEDQVLSQILYELRMAYLARGGRTGA
jgi:hypothetical protein